MHAMIFAAGLGTRLRPLTHERPKPVVPVGLQPLAAHSIERLKQSGISRVVFNTHHLGERVQPLLHDALGDLDARFLHEQVLLGTAGGLRNALEHLQSDDVIVVNGDILYAPDFADIVQSHRRSGALATLVLRDDATAFAKGAIEFDDQRVVRRMLAKEADARSDLHAAMFTGVHVIRREAIAELPQQGCIVRQGYLSWLARGEKINAYMDNSAWRDLGTLQEYLAGNVEMAASQSNHADASLVALGAVIGQGARLSQCVIGADAHVAAGVTLERVVVWPGARVETSLKNAVVTQSQVVNVVD